MSTEFKENIGTIRSTEKNFGIVFSIICFLLFIYFLKFNSFKTTIIYGFAFLSIFFLITAFFYSKILYYPNYLWFKFGMLLSMIISPIVLFLIFSIAFVFIGLLIKIFKGNLLHTKFDFNKKTYWESRQYEIQNMKDQF